MRFSSSYKLIQYLGRKNQISNHVHPLYSSFVFRQSFDWKERSEQCELENLNNVKDDSYYEGSEHESDQEDLNLGDLAIEVAEAAAKKNGMASTIKPGDWISYQSQVMCIEEDKDNRTYISIAYGNPLTFKPYQIFKDKTQFTRVIRVTGDEKHPIDLENDDVLDIGNTVRLLESDGKDGYIPRSGVSRLLGDFEFQKGNTNILVRGVKGLL
jgi:hypothetical protein